MKTKLTKILLIASLSATTTLMAGFANTDKLLVEAKKEAGEIKPSQLKKMLDKEEEIIVLDVREFEQRAEGEIYADDSYAITRGNLEFHIGNQIKNKDAIIVTYCRGGNRGALAAQTLKRLGYKNAINLHGGLIDWANAGYPIETGLGSVVLSKEEE